MDVKGKRILVVGLARSGLAVATALSERGAAVTVIDNKPPAAFRDLLPQLLKAKMGLELGSQRLETFLRHEAVVISPGVPWDLPQLQTTRGRGIPVYPEVEAASWFLKGTLIGVTGSNGKTTTTSLLGDMLKASGFPTFVGGNIGHALSTAVDHAAPGTRFVTELSSFQLEGIHELRPHVAVMLNLSPNHLDRHPSLEAYAEAKCRIFRNQGPNDFAVLNADDPWVAGLQSSVPSQPVFFSRTRELPNGIFVSGDKIYYRVQHLERVLFERRDVSLRGDFNLEDVLAATTAACLLGADFAAIRRAVREFRAVEHRLEFVKEIQGVDFYNNSKATSVDATLKSLGAFAGGVHLILGGKDKGAPYTPLIPLIKERVRDIQLIGAAAPLIAEQLAGATEIVQAGDLSTAVHEAFARSTRGDTVLLAPACSSFDQFTDYEERGRIFKELVARLAKDVEAGIAIHATRAAEPPPPTEPPAAEASSGPVVASKPPVVATAAVTPVESHVVAAEALSESEPIALEELRDEPVSARDSSDLSAGIRIADSAPALPDDAPPGRFELLPVEQGSPGPDSDLEDPDEVPAEPRESAAGHDASTTDHDASTSDRSASATHHGDSTEDWLDRVDLLPSAPSPRFDELELSKKRDGERNSTPSVSAPPGAPKASAPAAKEAELSRHLELTYVYELDAVDLSAAESQHSPQEEPEVYVLAGPPEVLDDEALPFEVRSTGQMEPSAPSGESKSPGSASDPQPKQPRQFNGRK